MKRSSSIRSSVSILVIFFFLCSIVCSDIIPPAPGTNSCGAAFVKKPTPTTKPGTQLGEKVESEDDVKLHHAFFPIYELVEIIHFDATRTHHVRTSNAFRFQGNFSGIPLYIIKRSILI